MKKSVKSVLTLACVALFAVGMASCQEKKSAEEKVEDGIEQVGEGLEQGAEQATEAVEQGAEQAAEAVEQGAEQVADQVQNNQ